MINVNQIKTANRKSIYFCLSIIQSLVLLKVIMIPQK